MHGSHFATSARIIFAVGNDFLPRSPPPPLTLGYAPKPEPGGGGDQKERWQRLALRIPMQTGGSVHGGGRK